MKKLGIDVDGVVADFVSGFYKLGNKMCGTGHVLPPTTWDFEDKFTKEQYKAIWAELRTTPNFWESLRPLPGTGKLKSLPKDVQPIFVTQRLTTAGKSPYAQTCAFLRNWFYISYPCVLVVENAADKVAICKSL